MKLSGLRVSGCEGEKWCVQIDTVHGFDFRRTGLSL